MPYYAERYKLRPEHFPVATHASRQMLSLPLYPGMSELDVERVVAALRASLAPRMGRNSPIPTITGTLESAGDALTTSELHRSAENAG